MKFSTTRSSAIFLISLLCISWSVAIFAQEQQLSPNLEVKIGDFGDASDFKVGYGGTTACAPGQSFSQCINVPWLGMYINAIFRYGLGLAAILATVMIMIGGFLWLTSAGSPDRVGKAKEYITSALLGLFLLLFSYVILYTINPRLVALEPISVGSIQNIKVEDLYPAGVIQSAQQAAQSLSANQSGVVMPDEITSRDQMLNILQRHLPVALETADTQRLQNQYYRQVQEQYYRISIDNQRLRSQGYSPRIFTIESNQSIGNIDGLQFARDHGFRGNTAVNVYGDLANQGLYFVTIYEPKAP